MVLKNEKPIKKKRISDKTISEPNKSTSPIMSTFYIFIFIGKKDNIKGFGHKSSLISKIGTKHHFY